MFATCYVNYNEPGIGHDLLKLLVHNEIPYRLVEKEACCGMPKLELGDLESVARLKEVNIPPLAALAREGYAILDGGAFLHADVQAGAAAAVSGRCRRRGRRDAMFDPFEYLVLRDKDGLLDKTFMQPLGKVSYHIPCHSRVQNVGTEDARSAAMGARYRSQHGRALCRSRRYLGCEERVFRRIDADRQACL